MPYLFQDTDLAARRLSVLAEVFTPAGQVYHLPVSTRQAATMFLLNIPAWKLQPFIQKHYELSEIEQLEQAMHELVEHATAEDEIEWGMRQVAYEHI